MTNLDSIFKSRDITLPTKVHLVKAMDFPVVIYRCESWTVKKAAAAAAAAAKSHQSCPTLCNPIDGSPPGSSVPDSPGKNTGVGCHFLLQCMKVKSESEVAQSCLTLSDPMDCSPPGSTIHGIFQARVLEWGAISFSPVENGIHINSFPQSTPAMRTLSWNFQHFFSVIHSKDSKRLI